VGRIQPFGIEQTRVVFRALRAESPCAFLFRLVEPEATYIRLSPSSNNYESTL
jgi:hypothetical protein